MRKPLLLLTILCLLLPLRASAQSTTLSGQITDTNSQSWNNGTYSFTFNPNPNYLSSPYVWSGGALTQTFTGSLNGTGGYSQSLPSNTSINPTGSKWSLTFCSGTTPPACFTDIKTITGTTQTINETPTPPVVNPGPNAAVYATNEVVGASVGSTVYLIGTGLTSCSAASGGVCSTWASSGGGGLPAGGNVGQALINTGSGTGTWQDPNVSNNPMVLLSTVAATGTQTGSAVKIPVQSALGVLVVTGAGITGSPSGCTIVLELQQSTGAPTSAAIATQAFTPASSYQSFQIVPAAGFTSGDNMIAVYACSTTYPSAGTITVTFNPQYASPSPSNGGYSVGQRVTTSDFLWAQVTTQGSSLGGVPASVSLHNSVRILQDNGQINTTTWDVATCTLGTSVGGVGTGQAVPVNGWIQGWTTVSLSASSVPQGGFYYNQYLLVSLPAGGGTSSCVNGLAAANIGYLLSGWPSGSFYPGGYPYAGVQSPWSIRPYTQGLTISNPSAGADFTQINGFGSAPCIQGVDFTFTTSATAGSRYVAVEVLVAGVPLVYQSTTPQGPSIAVNYSFSPGATMFYNTLSGVNFQSVPFANGQPVCWNTSQSGSLQIRSLTNNIQAADAYTGITVLTTQVNDNN